MKDIEFLRIATKESIERENTHTIANVAEYIKKVEG